MPDVVDVNLFFKAKQLELRGGKSLRRSHLLYDENFVDCTDPANRDALFFAQHGCRDGENRQEKISPALKGTVNVHVNIARHEFVSICHSITCRLFSSRRFCVEDECGKEEDAADDLGSADNSRDLQMCVEEEGGKNKQYLILISFNIPGKFLPFLACVNTFCSFHFSVARRISVYRFFTRV
jgi:hypothetical protein